MRSRREPTRQRDQTYFVTSQTTERKPFFRHERWADLFFTVLEHYRKAYLLHAFVLMPDHFHLLITPAENLEKALQLIKGGFSYRAKRELNWSFGIWQAGFSDHRIRDFEDFSNHLSYIQQNPVRASLCGKPEEYRYSSASGLFPVERCPQRLKPPGGKVLTAGLKSRPSKDGKCDSSAPSETAGLKSNSSKVSEAECDWIHLQPSRRIYIESKN